jgi:hypothetical protein
MSSSLLNSSHRVLRVSTHLENLAGVRRRCGVGQLPSAMLSCSPRMCYVCGRSEGARCKLSACFSVGLAAVADLGMGGEVCESMFSSRSNMTLAAFDDWSGLTRWIRRSYVSCTTFSFVGLSQGTDVWSSDGLGRA